jgi:hypothetical protein
MDMRCAVLRSVKYKTSSSIASGSRLGHVRVVQLPNLTSGTLQAAISS